MKSKKTKKPGFWRKLKEYVMPKGKLKTYKAKKSSNQSKIKQPKKKVVGARKSK